MHLLVPEFFVIFLIVKISSISSELNATKNCVTPTGALGECQYIRLCKSLFTLLQKELLTKNDRTHLKKSQCGYKNHQPLVCCPDNFITERPPVTTTPNESNEGCVTPTGAEGLCQYLRSCDSLFKLLHKKPFTSSDKTHLAKSQCGYKNHQPLVCCPDNFITERSPVTTTPNESNEGCVTPTGAQGLCQYLRSCDSLFKLLHKKPFTSSDKTHLAKSPCGYKNHQPLVCCPDNFITERPPVTTTPNESNEGCVTPTGAQGLCQYLRSCDSLFKLLHKKPFTSSDKTHLAKSQCGYKNHQPLVCCPDNFITERPPVTTTPNESNEGCVTPTGAQGLCQYLRSCDSLFNLLQKKTFTSSDKTHLTKSQCGYKNHQPLVCCPDNFITERPPVTTTPNESNEGCVTPTGAQGLCQYLKSCDSLFKLLQKKTLTSSDKTHLTKSQCGYSNRQRLVCCPDALATERQSDRNGAMLLPKPGVCGRGTTDRIIGGTKTAIDEYPWMALLEYLQPNNITAGFLCSGVLINQRYVVTASHCLNENYVPSTWTLSSVRLGEWNLETDPDYEEYEPTATADPVVNILIEEKILHNKYNPNNKNQHNDIALLRLASNVQYTDFINPICLPRSESLKTFNYDGISLQTAGWGRTEKTLQSNVKLKVNVDGVNIDACNKVYNRQRVTIRTSQICAGGKRGMDSCHGDSGGPLMMLDQNVTRPYWYLVGIVSYGSTPCGLQGWPGVYTRISSYVDWIESKIRA